MNNIDVKFGGYHKEFVILTPENYEKLPAYMHTAFAFKKNLISLLSKRYYE